MFASCVRNMNTLPLSALTSSAAYDAQGEEPETQMCFFLFSQFWPIEIFIVEKRGYCH